MTGFLLSVHVIAAILAIGPVAVATSMFPPALRAHLTVPEDAQTAGTLLVLARVTRVYSAVGMIVPIFGFATGASLGVLGEPWLIASMVLTGAAAVVLAVLILPAQDQALASLRPEPSSAARTAPGAPASSATPGPAVPTPAVPTPAVPTPVEAAPVSTTVEAAAVSTTVEAAAVGPSRRLAMWTGIFNLLWAVVVVLMIYRPGSTTGVGG